MEVTHLISDIWNIFYVDGPETNTEQKLEIIRILMKHSDIEDIELFNYWARKINIPGIELS